MSMPVPERPIRRRPAPSPTAPSPVIRPSIRSVVCGPILMFAVAAAPDVAFVPAPAETPHDVMRNRTLEGIYDRVELTLRHAGGVLEGSALEIRVAPGGVVILQGAVPEEAARRRALELARRQVGVTEVRDALQIDPTLRPEPSSTPVLGLTSPASAGASPRATSAETVPDARLAAAIAERLARALDGSEATEVDGAPATWRIETEEGALEVVAESGHVRLDGEVESPEQVARLARRFEASPSIRSLEIHVEEVDDGGFWDFLGL